MFFHFILVSAPNAPIQTDGVDSFVIALGYRHLYDQNIQLQIKLEFREKAICPTLYININNIYKKLGQTLFVAYPAYHALTGCDSSSFFSRKGIVRPFKLS